MAGYVAMARDWQAHEIFEGEEFSRRDAWAWMIAHAAWKETKARTKASRVTLGRGELTFSMRFLAQKWGWSKSRVDRFLAILKEEGMITTRTEGGTPAGQQAGQNAGHAQTVITICNYAKYQSPLKGQRDSNEPGGDPKAGQQRDKEEEGKESKKDNMGRKSALADDWEPDQFGEGTDCRNIVNGWTPEQLRHQVERFKSHHQARGNRFVSWQSAWKTWVLNAAEFAPRAPMPARDESNLVELIHARAAHAAKVRGK